MNKFILTLIVLVFSSFIYGQNGFEDWDKNYSLVNVKELIENEVEYAKKVEADTAMAQYYSAMNSYRFLGKFTGKTRDVDNKVNLSIKNVFKLRNGNADIIDELVSKELEIRVNDLTFWMPIQNQLLEPFENEVRVKKEVLIYAMFTNEHLFKGELINTFLISEFNTEWRK